MLISKTSGIYTSNWCSFQVKHVVFYPTLMKGFKDSLFSNVCHMFSPSLFFSPTVREYPFSKDTKYSGSLTPLRSTLCLPFPKATTAPWHFCTRAIECRQKLHQRTASKVVTAVVQLARFYVLCLQTFSLL